MSGFFGSILIACLISGIEAAVSTSPSSIYDSAIFASANAYSFAGGTIFLIFLYGSRKLFALALKSAAVLSSLSRTATFARPT